MAKSKPAGYESKFNAGLVEGLKVVSRPGKLSRKEPEGAGYVKVPDNKVPACNKKDQDFIAKRSGLYCKKVRTLLQKGQDFIAKGQDMV